MSSDAAGHAGLHLIAMDPGSEGTGSLREWYEAQFLPRVLGVEGVTGVSQWEAVRRYVRGPEGGNQAAPAFPAYIVIYELENVDVALSSEFISAKGRAFGAVPQANGEQRMVKIVMSVTMSEIIRQENPGAGSEPGGMMVVSLTPERDYIDSFHEWYDSVHLGELLSCPGFQRARRYRALEGIPNFFALYDLDHPGVLDWEKFVGYSTRKFEQLPAIQQKVGPHMVSNMCDVYRRLV